MVEDRMKRRPPDTRFGALDLIEEAVHVLRLAQPGTLLCYYAGSIPFVLAALFFWSDMSRSGRAEQHLIGGAIGLSLLFAWMKTGQAIFARRLSAQLSGEPAPKMKPGALLHLVARQTLVQATGLFLIPIAAQLLLPTAWVFAFYQNATVLGPRETSLRALLRRSWNEACRAPMQNHASLSVLALFGFFIFLNVVITLLAAPQLLKMLAGVESPFTLSLASSLNTTFLAAALGVTYLCFDPIVKTVYTLRCFYGDSRHSGEDLRVALRGFRPTVAVVIILLSSTLLGLGAKPAVTPPVEAPPAPASERGASLDRSIEEVLRRPEYTWRLPRTKTEVKVGEEKESALWQRFRTWARDTARSIRDWLDKQFRNKPGPIGTPGKFSFSPQGLVYILIAVVLAIIMVLIWLLWRSRSRSTQAELEATPAAPVPDLTCDDVTGDELPVDGWTKLALELLERGEFRLAMRAFYLSSLAHLAGRNLVQIAKSKSNRDYERELLRRSHALPDLTRTFSENVFVFDRVWYGRHDINADLLQQFRGNVERIKAC